MPDIPIERIKQIKSFPSLVKFLRYELDWPLESDEIEELVFEYEADELGIEPKIAVNIKEIKQLRPLTANQPWGIFYIGFEPKRLPVVVLRRVLQKLVIKKRQSAQPAHRSAWQLHDLLFISSYGEEKQRAITFAHFSEDEESKLPTLRVIGWDSQDTPLHMDRCIHELQNLTFDEELSPDKWREQWSEAFTLEHREVITTSKALAKKLAALAGRIRKRVNKILAVESKKGPMRQLYKAFQETLIHNLSEDDFADMYAQTITYGLFSTKKSRPAGLVAENLLDMIPKTNPFLKELLSTFLTVGGRKGKIDFDELGIDDVVQTLRNTDMDAVLRDFEDRNPLEDPVIHFYEGFLKEYDAKKKIKRGVFYTPRPVVSFIVRSVDEILRKDFGLVYGLADTITWGEMARRNKDMKIPEGVSENDPFVQILDPAAGTGTFLVEVIDLIYKTMKSKWEKEGHLPLEFNNLWNEYIPKYLLPRLYGFELMMAPYAIAHMKIGLKLFETGYRFDSDERARIYLTNTLEKPKDISEYFEQAAPALAHEAQAANKVKDEVSTTVIIGNPPYAGHSANKNDWIRNLLRTKLKDGANSYFEVDGTDLNERNPKWINDDYVKFIRYGQYRLSTSGTGVLGFITNHGYLCNPTFRGMRQSIMKSFSEIMVLDIHGNTKKKEKCPDGSKDENVFDIQQGVTIGLFLKREGNYKVLHADLWGLRSNKYSHLLSAVTPKAEWTDIIPQTDLYLFEPQNTQLLHEYNQGWKITDIFITNSVGILTARDNLTIHYSESELWNAVKDFTSLSVEDARREYNLGRDARDWKVNLAQEDIRYSGPKQNNITNILYRPFDIRFTYYTGRSRGFLCMPRPELMRHFLIGNNIGLVSARSNKSQYMDHFFISKYITEIKCGESTTGSCLFPLYLYPDPTRPLANTSDYNVRKIGRMPNLDKRFVEELCSKLNLDFISEGTGDLKRTFGPEDLLHYIYAIFYSCKYRNRYLKFLRLDYPKISFTNNISFFKALCKYGNELTSLHLLDTQLVNKPIATFPISGNNAVIKAGKQLSEVVDGKGKIYINKTQYFDELPEEVWNFSIGGYQVCHKWLAYRKKSGRKLSAEDIEHYHKIVLVIDETIKIMKQIDEVIAAHGGWPIK
jgi:predicted helicase